MGASETTTNTQEARKHDEYQYLELLRTVLDKGEIRADRTGTGTVSIFAPPQLRFSLENGAFPLLTTKRVFLRGVIEELLWFIHGSTDSKLLSDRGIKIWDGNGSKEFLESRGLGHRREGDLGPVYGFQWRHFGAEYVDCTTDYQGQGVDQLNEVIRKIKHEPTDRRIILSAWNPAGWSTIAFFALKLNTPQTCPKWHYLHVICFANFTYICQLFQRTAQNFLALCINVPLI